MRRDISNVDIVVYALASLGGATKKITTEDIAHKAFQLAPDRFSWVLEKYHQFPDKYVIKTALSDAAKAEYGSLVDGAYARDLSKDGWVLTSKGVRWFEGHNARIGSALDMKEIQQSRLPPTEVKRLRSRMLREDAFRSYKANRSLEKVSLFMFTDMLQCSPDATKDLIRLKFDRLLAQAELTQDAEILSFLRECQQQFQGFLSNKTEDNSGQKK